MKRIPPMPTNIPRDMISGQMIMISVRWGKGEIQMNEYITPKYETIGVAEKRKLLELMQSGLLNAFSPDDYVQVVMVLKRVAERLEEQR